MIAENINSEIEKLISNIQKQLAYAGFTEDARLFFRISLITSLVLCLASFVYAYAILFSLIPMALFFVVPGYFVAKRKSEIEYYLTDALFQASSLSEFMGLDEVVKSLSESNYGALSEEFAIVYRQIKAGAPFESAIKHMIKRNNSRILERTMNLILMGYSTGADISQSLKEVAEDLSKTYDSYRQRAASLTVEKYTLLASASFIVPALIGLMISLVNGFDLSNLQELGLGLANDQKSAILNNSMLGNQIYIILYSFIASIFIALQENRIEKSLIYITIITPLSYLVFAFFMTVKVL